MTDWNEVKGVYITDTCTLKELGLRYGLHPNTISRRAAKEGWREQRRKHQQATLDRALDLVERSRAEKMARMEEVSGRLLDRVDEAISQLDIQVLREVHKDRSILYENAQRPDKPTRETSVERELLSNERVPIDRNGIKLLAAALKDIKDVQMLRPSEDLREQEAKIKKLLGESMKDEAPERVLEITFDPEVEEVAG
ncbi:MAG: hypothetical protein IKT58_05625 [Oscillospiraceae bacterium]|nr:hypothetical protein [Oscillospiraceae bacterium]